MLLLCPTRRTVHLLACIFVKHLRDARAASCDAAAQVCRTSFGRTGLGARLFRGGMAVDGASLALQVGTYLFVAAMPWF